MWLEERDGGVRGVEYLDEELVRLEETLKVMAVKKIGISCWWIWLDTAFCVCMCVCVYVCMHVLCSTYSVERGAPSPGQFPSSRKSISFLRNTSLICSPPLFLIWNLVHRNRRDEAYRNLTLSPLSACPSAPNALRKRNPLCWWALSISMPQIHRLFLFIDTN